MNVAALINLLILIHSESILHDSMTMSLLPSVLSLGRRKQGGEIYDRVVSQ